MAYLAKSLKPQQAIIVRLTPGADQAEVVRRLSLGGVRFKVISMDKPGWVRMGCSAPHGLTPAKVEACTAESRDDVGCLALARNLQEEIIVSLAEGADAGAVLDWLESDGLTFKFSQLKGRQVIIHVIAHDGLLVLRDELASQV